MGPTGWAPSPANSASRIRSCTWDAVDVYKRQVTGSPGGGRIITIALETILNALVFGMNAQQAVDAPRVHMQWLPDEVQYEPGALTPETMDALRANGYRFRMLDPWGVAQVILVDPVTGTRYGGSARSRPGGAALGY